MVAGPFTANAAASGGPYAATTASGAAATPTAGGDGEGDDEDVAVKRAPLILNAAASGGAYTATATIASGTGASATAGGVGEGDDDDNDAVKRAPLSPNGALSVGPATATASGFVSAGTATDAGAKTAPGGASDSSAGTSHNAAQGKSRNGHYFHLYPPQVQLLPLSTSSENPRVCCGGVAVEVRAHTEGLQQISSYSISGTYYVFPKYGLVMREEMYERLRLLRRWDVKLYRTAVVLQQLDVWAVQLLQQQGLKATADAEKDFVVSSSGGTHEDAGAAKGSQVTVGDELGTEVGQAAVVGGVGKAIRSSGSIKGSGSSSSSTSPAPTNSSSKVLIDPGVGVRDGGTQALEDDTMDMRKALGDSTQKLPMGTCHMRNGPVPQPLFSRAPSTWEEGLHGPLAPPVPSPLDAGVVAPYSPKVVRRVHMND
jgi:hypothetical protein